MNHRRKKQLIYGIGFVVFIALFAAGIFFAFVREKPSCFDTVQNQNEEGIDCGGTCARVCIGQPIELIAKPDVFAIDTNRSSILAKIRNLNPKIAIRRFAYSFNVYAAGDIPLQTLEGESFLYASEVKYLLVPGLNVSAERVSRIDFKTRIIETVAPDAFQKPNIVIQGHEAVREDPHILVRGSMFNQDKIPATDVQVVAIFEGTFGQLVGASFTSLDRMNAGEQKEFTILYPFDENIDTQKTQLFLFARQP